MWLVPFMCFAAVGIWLFINWIYMDKCEKSARPEDRVGMDGMKIVEGMEFGGERALFAVRDVALKGCTFHVGESALKRTANIVDVCLRVSIRSGILTVSV